jgi:hypothetical protein
LNVGLPLIVWVTELLDKLWDAVTLTRMSAMTVFHLTLRVENGRATV